uniref:Uncharacterized protein n=1 Tax=Kalanchoe fedtschenkoi TaxID=63787 RepID=A0A7N0UNC6_KALFE
LYSLNTRIYVKPFVGSNAGPKGLTPEGSVKGKTGKFKTRCTPQRLHQILGNLTEQHRRGIKELGFGSILELRFWELPSRFGRWLVESFDANRCTLDMKIGRLHITVDDIERILGLPKVGQLFKVNDKSISASKQCMEWRTRYGTVQSTLSVTSVMEKIAGSRKPNKWFYFDFLVLFTSTIVEGMKNGFANQKILNFINDPNEAKQMNWCQYVLDSLQAGKVKWIENRKKSSLNCTFCQLVVVLFYKFFHNIR